MIKCIIIDDEGHAIDLTRKCCAKIPYLEVIGEFTETAEAVSFIDQHKKEIDLVFLDIQMPRFSGIDFLKAHNFPNVILVTGFDEYALDSYAYGVKDYLLKPFSFERFSLAVQKVYDAQDSGRGQAAETKEKDDEVLYLKTERNKYVRVAYRDIRYIQATGNYSLIYTATDQLLATQRLKDFEEILPKGRFFRIHKSHIIHMDYFESLDDNTIKLKEVDSTLQLGTVYRQDFINFLKQKLTPPQHPCG